MAEKQTSPMLHTMKAHEPKTLIHNWWEEKQTFDMDKEVLPVRGHEQITNPNPDSKVASNTEYLDRYYAKNDGSGSQTGVRREELRKAILMKIATEECEEAETVEPTNYTSEFEDHFTREFTSVNPVPTQAHSLYEMPVSYWTEQLTKVQGTTQNKTRDSPFKKNTAFSKPIEEYWDESKPYELENYPHM